MYGHFIQLTIPKIGQALVAVVLYLNFLKLPFVACFAGMQPAVYLLLPLLLLLPLAVLKLLKDLLKSLLFSSPSVLLRSLSSRLSSLSLA